MSNSPLVSYTRLSPNCTRPRSHRIDTITIHHTAGVGSVESIGGVFASTVRQASANYGIGNDGSIGLYVEESDRAWTSSSPANDHRAVTIEVSNCAGAPDWPVSEKAYAALIELVADICRRNGIQRLVWSEDKADRVGHRNGCNMTVHRDFAATACPGPYLMAHMGDIARSVNEKLEEDDGMTEEQVRRIARDEFGKLEEERARLPVSGWAKKEVEAAKAAGIMDGTRPQSYATRQEVAIMVGRERSE